MASGHRPTFHNAIGGSNQGGNFLVTKSTKVSSRDLTSHTTLKRRQVESEPLYTQDKEDIDKEKLSTKGLGALPADERRALLQKQLQIRETKYQKPNQLKDKVTPIELDSRPASIFDEVEEHSVNPFPEDADDEGPAHKADEGDGSDSDEDEEEAELMRELEQIKRERQQAKLKEEEERLKEVSIDDRERALISNPLLVDNKRQRWDDDVVFRNQIKNLQKPKKRFINDTVRSDFHRRFLSKYVV